MRLFLAAVLICSPSLSLAAIFGVDDRVSVAPGSFKSDLARSTAVGVLAPLVEESSPGRLRLQVDRASSFLCSDQRFADETSLAYACSGFLVAPDLLVTAGHCMVNGGETRDEEGMYCEAYQWLFDYAHDAEGKVPVDGLPAENLYRCKKIIYAVSDEGAPWRDYALIQLDRPVAGRKPLRLASGPLPKSSRLHMIGHPLGLPAKVSRGARVLVDQPERQSFITTLDAFEGNSGSAVFNSKDEVVGILIGGTPTTGLIDDRAASCGRVNTCREDGTGCDVPERDTAVFAGFQRIGSEVQRIAPLEALIRAHQESTSRSAELSKK